MFENLRLRYRAGTLFLWGARAERAALEAAESVRFIHGTEVDFADEPSLLTAGYKVWVRGRKYGQWFILNEEPEDWGEFDEVLTICARRWIATLCGTKPEFLDKIQASIGGT